MDIKIGFIGTVLGFILYILFSSAVVSVYVKNFVFLLPFFLFLIGIAIGYFVKKFKDSLLCGGIASVTGIVIILLLNFEHYITLIISLIANAIGLFFGYGFGAILYYRILKKEK